VEYHLAVVFVTESQPGGGWWWASRYGNQPKSQVSERDLLVECRHQVRRLERKALSFRMFGVACGTNLLGRGVVDKLQNQLTS
jgi:hypothetical protein